MNRPKPKGTESEPARLTPSIETLILDFVPISKILAGGPDDESAWFCGTERVAYSWELQTALDVLGKSAYRIVGTGGVNVESGFGPTRIFLQRLVMPEPSSQEPEKPVFLGLGDEE